MNKLVVTGGSGRFGKFLKIWDININSLTKPN